jgi:hypothetical protein
MRSSKLLLCAIVVCLGCSGDDAGGSPVADGGAGTAAGSSGGHAGSAAGSGGGAGSAANVGDGSVSDASETAADGGGLGSDAGVGTRPHPLYPALDLDTLPGPGGAVSGAYEPPMLPETTRTVMVTTTGGQARADLAAACQMAGTAVTVPSSAGRIGTVDFGNVTDCDVTLGADVIADLVYVGHLPGPTVAPAHRVRIRGGQIGYIMVDPGSTDIVFDGVTVNNAVVPPAQRVSTGIYLIDSGGEVVERFAFVNSVLRMVATLPDGGGASDGCAYLAGNARNVLFANVNIVTAGNRNSWAFRISGGDNFLIVDSTVRVAFHKMIRMNDDPVDYVYVKGGVWMRQDSTGAAGEMFNDTFAQIGDSGTDHVYIHDTTVYLESTDPLYFGATNGPGQVAKSWQVRGVAWHAPSASVVSDTILQQHQSNCSVGGSCDYGVGTHSYDYASPLVLPDDAWRSLPGLAEDDPDALPITN